MKKKLTKLAILASGNGTTLQAVIDAIKEGKLNAKIHIVISNNENAYALERAKKENIDYYVLKNYQDENELSKILKEYNVDLIILAGYLKLLPSKIINDYVVINTHPSLLPKYGGQGMYGMNVHQAIVDNHEKETGVTLHFVNEEYDKGKIISQTKVKVYSKDTAEDVSNRVQTAEKIQLIDVLKDFSEGKIDLEK